MKLKRTGQHDWKIGGTYYAICTRCRTRTYCGTALTNKKTRQLFMSAIKKRTDCDLILARKVALRLQGGKPDDCLCDVYNWFDKSMKTGGGTLERT